MHLFSQSTLVFFSILLKIPSRSTEMEASLSETALKSALLSTLSWNDLEEIELHENPLWNDDLSERREPKRDRDTEATYSVSIGLRDSTCRSYVETIASGTDSLLVCRIASYIVFVLLMRPDLAAFVRYKQPPHINTSGTLPFGQVHLETGTVNTVRISTWELVRAKCPPHELLFTNIICLYLLSRWVLKSILLSSYFCPCSRIKFNVM